jgi:prepilin-type N-terminal cleavage/methylation domain-containing protein
MRLAASKAGFSLPELLVSLVILGLIAMASVSALSTGKRIWSTARLVPEATLTEAEIHQLRSAVARKISDASSQGGGVSGTSAQLSFTGLERSGQAFYASGTVTLRVVAEGLEIQSELGRDIQTKRLRHLPAKSLSYFGRKPGTSEEAWYKSWDASDQAPQLLRVEFADPLDRKLTELLIPFP